MKRICLTLIALWLAPPAALQAIEAARPAVRPNMIFLLTDDQRDNTLGAMGHPFVRTPHLDRLAADMHSGIDAYERMALDCRDAENRETALEAAMYGYLSKRLREHGFKGDDDTMRSILDIDVTLNAAGLAAWLNRLDKTR